MLMGTIGQARCVFIDIWTFIDNIMPWMWSTLQLLALTAMAVRRRVSASARWYMYVSEWFTIITKRPTKQRVVYLPPAHLPMNKEYFDIYVYPIITNHCQTSLLWIWRVPVDNQAKNETFFGVLNGSGGCNYQSWYQTKQELHHLAKIRRIYTYTHIHADNRHMLIHTCYNYGLEQLMINHMNISIYS